MVSCLASSVHFTAIFTTCFATFFGGILPKTRALPELTSFFLPKLFADRFVWVCSQKPLAARQQVNRYHPAPNIRPKVCLPKNPIIQTRHVRSKVTAVRFIPFTSTVAVILFLVSAVFGDSGRGIRSDAFPPIATEGPRSHG